MIDVRLRLSEADLLDAGEEIGGLLAEDETFVLSPPLRDVLLSIDDASTAAYQVEASLARSGDDSLGGFGSGATRSASPRAADEVVRVS